MEKVNRNSFKTMAQKDTIVLMSSPYEGAEDDWRLFDSLSADERTMVVEYTRKLLASSRNRKNGRC